MVGSGRRQARRVRRASRSLKGQVWYVWLMTVDRALNGQNGGKGATGGNWYPSSPTAGIPAASALIPTVAIAPAAISQVYQQTGTFSGVATGVTGDRVPHRADGSTGRPLRLFWRSVYHGAPPSVPSCLKSVRVVATGPVWGESRDPEYSQWSDHLPLYVRRQNARADVGRALWTRGECDQSGWGEVAFTVAPTAIFSLEHVKK